MDPLVELMQSQAGVVARRQLLHLGWKPHEIRSGMRRHELAPLFPGVMVNHTGKPSWLQRAWGAVLYAEPAALAGVSAVRIAERASLDDTTDDTIHIAVDRHRKLIEPDGVMIVRRTRFDERIQPNLSPPRIRYDEAIVDLAAEAPDDLAAVAVLSRACASRRTTAARLTDVMAARPRITRRHWLLAVLRDIADGTHSVLEHGFLVRVERPHGLPRARRQVVGTSNGARVYRDVEHGQIVIELDGKAYHEGPTQRDEDLERDLDVLVEERTTVRLGWGQVFGRPCRTAAKVAAVLTNHGWSGVPRACASAQCAVRSIGVAQQH